MDKQCYLDVVSTKASMTEMQFVEEERKVPKDVARTLKDKVVNDLICYEFNEPSRASRSERNIHDKFSLPPACLGLNTDDAVD